MKNIEIGTKIEAYKSQCIGIMIDSVTISGKIVKVNAKSIVVEYDHILIKKGQKVTRDSAYAGKKNFKYWKTLSDGTVCYKNELDGIIRF